MTLLGSFIESDSQILPIQSSPSIDGVVENRVNKSRDTILLNYKNEKVHSYQNFFISEFVRKIVRAIQTVRSLVGVHILEGTI